MPVSVAVSVVFMGWFFKFTKELCSSKSSMGCYMGSMKRNIDQETCQATERRHMEPQLVKNWMWCVVVTLNRMPAPRGTRNCLSFHLCPPSPAHGRASETLSKYYVFFLSAGHQGIHMRDLPELLAHRTVSYTGQEVEKAQAHTS